MKIITRGAMLRCGHDGRVQNQASQQWVTVGGSAVLVQDDPEGRGIAMCPNIGINIKPCTRTLKVARGYSTFITIGARAVCLDSIEGFTDGTPPGAVKYTVRDAGQDWVRASS